MSVIKRIKVSELVMSLASYVSADDLALDREDFLRTVASRIHDDLPKRSKKALGKTQADVLRSLCEHGGYPGGWTWSTRSKTVALLDSLVKRGFAIKTKSPANRFSREHDSWQATPEALKAFKAAGEKRAVKELLDRLTTTGEL